MAQRSYHVVLDTPDDVHDAEVRAYIRDALKSHGGGYEPTDPFFNMRRRVISVRQQPNQPPKFR